jgi:hypothetical protein
MIIQYNEVLRMIIVQFYHHSITLRSIAGSKLEDRPTGRRVFRAVTGMTGGTSDFVGHPISMGDLQDPKMEVLYHIRPYFVVIFTYIGLIYGRYLHFRFLEWPLTIP